MALAGIFTGHVDAPLDYIPMLKRLVAVIRQKHYDKGVSYLELGIEKMMEIVKEEFKELEDELDPEDHSVYWFKVEREANHLALAALLVADIARLKEARS